MMARLEQNIRNNAVVLDIKRLSLEKTIPIIE
jgi:hypothetical protein